MASNLQKCTTNELLYIGFNQDFGCFAVGTDKGFRIYNCEPFKETFKRDFASGGIGMVEMLFRCNILALVGGGSCPKFPVHKVMIWDDHQNRCIGELSFRSEVRAVRLRRDRVVVALDSKVYVYNFADLSLLDHVITSENPKGLCVLCPHPTNNVLACPGAAKGHVRVELYDHRKTTLIAAHEAALACIALNATGTRLATASEKGTLIRVYDTMTGDLLQEVRRGTDKAEIYSLAFNASSSMLACTSDKGTVHIFKLKEAVHDTTATLAAAGTAAAAAAGAAAPTMAAPAAAAGTGATGGAAGGATSAAGGSTGAAASGSGTDASGEGAGLSASHAVTSATGAPAAEETTTGGGGGSSSSASAAASGSGSGSGGVDNTRSSFSFMKGILPKYFSSEWSFAQFRVPDTRSVVAFGAEPNTIIVVGADGSFFKANYEKGGEAVRVAYSHFSSAGWSSE